VPLHVIPKGTWFVLPCVIISGLPLSLPSRDEGLDNQTALRLRKRPPRGVPRATPPSEYQQAMTKLVFADLRRKSPATKVVVKLFLRYPLHAKLFREDYNNPIKGFLTQQSHAGRSLPPGRAERGWVNHPRVSFRTNVRNLLFA